MGPTHVGINERMIQDDIIEYRNKVLQVFERNGIEGRFPRSIKSGSYDNRIGYEVRSNTGVTPLEFVKRLMSDELM